MYMRLLLGMICMVAILGAQPGWAATVSLAWDANTESDLDGYRVHYGTTSRTQGNYTNVAVINDENATTFDIELPEGTYYFSLTAFDTSGNESDFSTEVRAVVSDSVALGKPGQPTLVQ